MGRPPKPPEERAQDQINVRITGEERARLDQLAVELRVTAGEVMRRGLAEVYERVFGRRGKTKP